MTGPDAGGWPAWFFTSWALRRAGAKPVRVTPRRPRHAQGLDGLVIGGGADVSDPTGPSMLQEMQPPQRGLRWVDKLIAPVVLLVRWLGATKRDPTDPARDRLELSLLEEARNLGLPVLGICRGAQLMNLHDGGTLMRHLSRFYEERPQMRTVLPRRRIEVDAHSRLCHLLGQRTSLEVNSLHKHAVETPGPHLRVVAREPLGVVQAIEDPEQEFWIGVQWHPEYLPQLESQRTLFSSLVATAHAPGEETSRARGCPT